MPTQPRKLSVAEAMFLADIVEVCIQHKFRLQYAGCGTHQIDFAPTTTTDYLSEFEMDEYVPDTPTPKQILKQRAHEKLVDEIQKENAKYDHV